MNHLNDDHLLRHALEAYESDDERAETTAHIAACAECRERFENVQSDVGVIASVQPRRRVLQMPGPRPRRTVVYSLLRAAALIIFGVVVGYGTSNWMSRQPAQVSPAYVTLSPPADSLRRYAASDATEVPAPYYEAILGDRE
jgi:hypothetical protein